MVILRVACDWVYHIVLVWGAITYFYRRMGLYQLYSPLALSMIPPFRSHKSPEWKSQCSRRILSTTLFLWMLPIKSKCFVHSVNPNFRYQMSRFWTKPIYISYSFPGFPKYSLVNPDFHGRNPVSRREKNWREFHARRAGPHFTGPSFGKKWWANFGRMKET